MHMIWSDRFVTGIKTLDLQHKALFAIINDLMDWREEGGDTETLGRIFQRLENYVRFHFDTEEALMDRAGLDPDYLAGHIAAHRDFCVRVSDCAGQLASLPEPALDTLLAYLVDWLQQHILEKDCGMACMVAASPLDDEQDRR